jgi:signal transduction histidine kinase
MRGMTLRTPRGWGAGPAAGPAAGAAVGLYRSAVLAALTGFIPVICAAVAWFGAQFAFSWTAQLHAPLAIRVLAAVGEIAMTIVWTAVAAFLLLRRGATPGSRAARRLARDWLGLKIEVRYAGPHPVTQMSTGFWWNGYEYYKTEREARWHARMERGPGDPQFRRDVQWTAIAAVTVFPVSVLPLLALGAGIFLLLQPGLLAWGIVLIVAALAGAPFAWRVLGPVAAVFLGPSARAQAAAAQAAAADMTQTQAAELERIERSLHDGAQARIVALGMAMGTVEHLIDTDPEKAKPIIAEARASAAEALTELRDLARGINPPVLSERGLVDAVRALALDAPVPVSVRSSLPSRPERPVEAAIYFAVAELLANIGKHAHATRASIELGYADKVLAVTVTDDGQGGAVGPTTGSGLNGIERRLAAFGGRVDVDSPVGGPTRVTLGVPCALS